LSAVLAAAAAAPAPAPPPAVSVVPAQGKEVPSLEQEFLKNFLRDQKAIWTSPYHVKEADAKWLVPLSAGTVAFVVSDRRIGDEFAESPQLIRIGNAVSYIGSGYTVGAATATFYLVGRFTGNPRARETGLLAAQALLDTAIVGGVIKVVTQRARPDAGLTRSEFFTAGSSFPSGHSLSIWSFATVVAHEYPDHRWIQITAYSTAMAVSAARVAAQRHYLSDVLVGGALGYAIGRYVYRTHQRLDRAGADSASASGLREWPSIAAHYGSAREYGVTFAWTVK
jgi:membrane-associated phospholipid phosphatase